jgi:A/G-specific adenine glycosylase
MGKKLKFKIKRPLTPHPLPLTLFQEHLLHWYHRHKRDLPWRRTKDPYKIWISEIMLQQTQVATVIDYYHRFLKRFPTIQSLASAKEEEVLALWSGLGYYSRAKNLHKAAQKIVREHEGKFPEDPETIQSLPGIGRYTLGAIASIAFDQALPVVDGNVIRVYSRLFALKGSPKESKFQKEIWGVAEEVISSPSPQPSPARGEGEKPKSPLPRRERVRERVTLSKTFSSGDFNQALMELGATVCTPQNPICLICPIQKFCKGKLLGPEQFPEKKRGPETKILKRVALVIEKNKKVLLCLSEKHRWMKGLWQLPGGFSENGEKPENLAKQFLKEMGLVCKIVHPLKMHTHSITHHKITLFPYWGKNPRGQIQKDPFIQRKWFSISELDRVALPSADRKILKSFSNTP